MEENETGVIMTTMKLNAQLAIERKSVFAFIPRSLQTYHLYSMHWLVHGF